MELRSIGVYSGTAWGVAGQSEAGMTVHMAEGTDEVCRYVQLHAARHRATVILKSNVSVMTLDYDPILSWHW